jgi:hypothetical protein
MIGRPANFSGAIGRFFMTVATKPDQISAGEPLTISTVIKGSGNLATSKCPEVTGSTLRSYPVKSTHLFDGLVCEQVIIPLTAGPLPIVEWSYFDPQKNLFESITKQLPIVATSLVATSPANQPPQSSQSLPHSRVPLAILAAIAMTALLATCVMVILRSRKSPTVPATRPHHLTLLLKESEQAVDEGDVGKFYSLAMLILQEAIGTQNNIPPQGIADAPIVPFGHLETYQNELAEIFQRCHQVRYGQFSPTGETVLSDYHRLLSILAALKYS